MQISEELNTIVSYAREEAMRTGSYAITPDHLFLGILRHKDNLACALLTKLDADLEELKFLVESQLFHTHSIPYVHEDKVVLNRHSQNCLSRSVYEALRLEAEEAGAIHLLLSLCRCEDSFCKCCLESIEIDANTLEACMRDNKLLDDKKKNPEPQEKPSRKNTARVIGTISIKAPEIFS